MKAVLVDTHFLLWTRAQPDKLTGEERESLENAALRLVSAATFWELSILMGLGRIGNTPEILSVPSGFSLLPILPEHCTELTGLPQIHRDPFDRMLIAQARHEKVTLMTRDEKIRLYDVPVS